MNFIGDYFALALAIVLFLFFIDNKNGMRHMATSAKLFLASLFMTAMTAVTDLATGYLYRQPAVPLWENMLVNTMYFLAAVVTTTVLALYLFYKILEHTHERHCMHRAYIGLTVIFVVYLGMVIANIWNKQLFYFLEDGTYCRGPLNGLGYIATAMQLILVLICFVRNRETASVTLHRVLLMISPVVPLCVIIHLRHPDIMLNSFIIALVVMVLFLTFQGQRHGVHSLTQLNDRHRFFAEVDHRITTQEPFQVFLINIKHFGAVNQKYGNRFGDEILYRFAFALEKLLPGSMTFHMNKNAKWHDGEPVTVALSPTLSPTENAQAYYKRYNKYKRAQTEVQLQLESTQEMLDYLASIEASLLTATTKSEIEEVTQELTAVGVLKEVGKKKNKAGWTKSQPLHIKINEDTDLYIGKNNKQNDYVTFTVGGPNDLWFHTKDIPGSHIILKTTLPEPTERDIDIACQLAGYFSKARNGSNIPVDCTKRRYVKKPSGSKPGFVIFTNNSTYYTTPDEALIAELIK